MVSRPGRSATAMPAESRKLEPRPPHQHEDCCQNRPGVGGYAVTHVVTKHTTAQCSESNRAREGARPYPRNPTPTTRAEIPRGDLRVLRDGTLWVCTLPPAAWCVLVSRFTVREWGVGSARG